MTTIDIGKLDPAMAVKPANTAGIAWYLPFEAPMRLYGFNWFAQDGKFERLPLTRPAEVTRFPNGKKQTIKASECGALILSSNTAGGQVRFRTDSTRFLIQATMAGVGGMDHMAFTGSAGFDIYLKCNGVWKCFGVTRTDHSKPAFSTEIVGNLKPCMHDVIIHFPLYMGVKSMAIGLDESATVEAPTAFPDDRPVVFYGTSITQGGCATRPGMASSNILSRLIDREVINLGFSGNGRGEPEIARMLADIKNPGMYLLDYVWNVQIDELKATLPDVINIIRKAHPDVPIMLVSPSPGRDIFPEFNYESRFPVQRDIMEREYVARRQQGDANVYFFDAFNDALGEDFWEGLVDGCHMTDVGFLRFAKAIAPRIQDILLKP